MIAPGAGRRAGFLDEAEETMPPEARRAFQESFLPHLVRYAYERVPLYRGKMDEAGVVPGDVRTLADLARLPLTLKDETRDAAFEGVMAVPYNRARRIFVSPGPQFYAYGPVPQEANPLLRVYHAVGFRPGDIVAVTFEYHLTPAGISFDESLAAFGCAVVPAGPHNAELQCEILRALPVTGYVGTPSSLAILAERARALGMDPARDFSLEVALTSAEPLAEPLRAEMQETYGASVRQLYGSADGLLPCYECWAADGMHVPDLMILEITDPTTGERMRAGEPGAVTATVFNPYRPLLRFRNGDRAALTTDPCRCGRTAPRLRLHGRLDEAAKVRGMFLHPDQVEGVMGRLGIERWRAVIERGARGRDELRVEVEAAADPALLGRVGEALRGVVRLRAEVVAVAPGSIPAGSRRVEDRR